MTKTTLMRLILNKLSISLCFLLLIGNVRNSLGAGGTVFPVLKELSDPRNCGLAGAVVADNANLNSAVINPAAAHGCEQIVTVSFSRQVVDMWSGNVSYVKPFLSRYSCGGYITTLNYGEIETSNLIDGKTGDSFNPSEYVFAVFAATELGMGLNTGVTLKFLSGSLDDESSNGLAFDLGANYDPEAFGIEAGISLRNVGSQLNGYGSETYPLPTELIIGGNRRLQHLPLTIHMAAILGRTGEGDWDADYLPGDPGLSLSISGEFEVESKFDTRPVTIRMGYRSAGDGLRVGHNLDTLAGMSFGFGLPYKKYQFDYVFAPMGALGDVHRFGFSTSL